MPNVIASDYQVLRDSELRLEDGESHQLQFDMQNAFHYSTALRNHGLLTFNIRPAGSGRLTARAIGSGPVTIMNRTSFSKSHTRMHQEAFNLDAIVSATSASIGQTIGSLRIEFRAEDGPLILSDIVIHYKIIIPIP
ncbi:hypothetical protein C1J03_14870 [Sulfitobacter sp. SK012]|uniref:hypothetical protein n=1 Tax=Sulfitobacter sp. SK012 TaxID=1389005 RepID=UPI000E0C4B3C|nr:hypothetical protein [Sulfitobacter sp. SK012]AXI47182.1 hypothetical protein C1J03_14870 [Sulfitobacter sp. SK012]